MPNRLSTANDSALLDLGEGKTASALAALRAAAWRDPSYKALVNVAAACRAAGELEAARDYLWRAAQFARARPEAWFNLANVETDCGNFDRALSLYNVATKCAAEAQSPDDVSSRISLGYAQALLREREFTLAWPLWEAGRLNYSWFPLPGTMVWAPGKRGHVFVVCEGGYGDAFLFSRWLPFLKFAGATEVTLMIWRCLLDWTDWSRFGVDHVVAKEDYISPEGIGYTASWMSLPAFSGMKSMLDLPLPAGWTSLSVDRAAPWAADYPRRPRIGFCWLAAEQGLLRKIRTLDAAASGTIARRLLELGDCASLVPGLAPAAGYSTLPSNATWTETAQAIAHLDYVVTTDTAVAHLSALLCIPTLILLPANSDWKYGRNSLTDEWYGPHVHYYRNHDPLQWDAARITERIEQALCIIPR